MSRLVALFVLVALFAVAYAGPQILISDGLGGLGSPIGLASWGGVPLGGISPLGLGSGTILLKK
ncbi:hypothetical protein Ocin01_01524 [Orchesella cincta]|uniref:Uncharacterized protein n=1 Tax=Orchesella cincta TaxID=48709 RepID=A0A1D2NJ33_ORCCI|nr:hypothetical protein Ocin01_01526 [Orchesella cincta]ODN05127.1 hypothetical protein Ocin01_01524 [Orchesella cincta]